MLGAYYGARRWDQFVDNHTTKEDEEKENLKLTNAIQTIGLGSVLIATATFATAFTLLGGYRSDSQSKSGTPTLADKYTFKVTSSKPHLKKQFVSTSLRFITWASRCTVISFTLAIFVVLAPVNKLLVILIVGAAIFQYDGVGRDHLLTTRVISGRQGWKQLFPTKLLEATLQQSVAAWLPYALSCIMYYTDLLLPIVITAVVPLIMDLVWDIGKSVVTYITSHV